MYVNNNWIDPYKNRFVSAWCDRYRSFNNNTTNRVESSHAHLKSLLNSSQGKLDQVVVRIGDIIKLQHTAIKDKLEKSKSKMCHRFSNLRLFRFLIFKVSRNGLKKIIGELERLNNDDEITAESCGCQLRTCCGLPCAHELQFYIKEDLFIPLDEIDIFWRTLDILHLNTTGDKEITCDEEIEMFKKSFGEQPKEGKVGLLRKLKDIIQPSKNVLGEPSVNRNNRGRPRGSTSKGKQPQQRFEPPRNSEYVYRELNDQPQCEPPRHSEYVYRDLNDQPQCEPPRHSEYMYRDLNDQPQSEAPRHHEYMSPPAYTDSVNQQTTSWMNNFFDQDPFMQNLINYEPLPTQVFDQSFNQEGTLQVCYYYYYYAFLHVFSLSI